MNSQQYRAQLDPGSGAVVPGPESGGTSEKALPPGAFEALRAAGGASMYVLSGDAELVATLQQTSDAQDAIVVVDEWPALVGSLDDGLCSIALLDMDSVGEAFDKRLAELERHAATPVIVAAAAISDATEPMRALTERRIHRLLIKPASHGNTRLLLESAINRWLQLHASDGRPSATVAPRTAVQGSSGGSGLKRSMMIATAMAVVFGVIVVAGLMRSTPRDPPPAVDSQPPVWGTVAVDVDPWAEPLARAHSAFEAGRLVEPAGDNALDGYAAILAAEPDHALAAEGLAATVDLLFTWAESALLGDALELAESTLDHVRRVRPQSARLAFLDTQLERAYARAEQMPEPEPEPEPVPEPVPVPQAQVAVVPAAPPVMAVPGADSDEAALAELESQLEAALVEQQREREAALLEAGIERLRSGQLLVPETDSAAFYLASLRAENPDHPGLPGHLAELAAMLTENFQAAVLEADWHGARSWLAGLERIDADAPLVSALAQELIVTQRQAEFLDTAAPSAVLTLVESRSPSYPEFALRTGIEGWVDVEFIVDRDGQPREIAVAGAQPAGSFDRAATDAISRYRYEPFVLDGVTYERRVRLRIRFTLQ